MPKDLSSYTDEELEQIAGAVEETTPSQDHIQKTEQLISGRQDELGQFLKNRRQQAQTTPNLMGVLGSMANPLDPAGQQQAGLQAMGGLIQRAEATIANPMILLGREFPQVMLGVPRADLLEDMVRDTVKGIRGERLGEFGDLMRQIGAPEQMAKGFGLMASIAFMNTATKGLLRQSAVNGGKFLKAKTPKAFNKDFPVDQAEAGKAGLDALKKAAGSELNKYFQQYGDDAVGFDVSTQQAFNRLPEAMVKKIFKHPDVKVNANTGELTPTLKNYHMIRKILSDSIHSKDWAGVPGGSADKALLKDAWRKLGDQMRKGRPQLAELQTKWSEFMDLADDLYPKFLDKNGKVVANKLKNMFKPGAERAYQQTFEKYVNMYPKAAEVMKNVKKLDAREAAKKAISSGTVGVIRDVIRLSILYRLLRKGTSSVMEEFDF